VVGIAATTGDPLPQCSGLTFTATTDRSSYSEGQPVTNSLTYRNPTAEACSANFGSTKAGCSDAFVFLDTGPPGEPTGGSGTPTRAPTAKVRFARRASTKSPWRRARR
jgi:hypothetical protein